MKRKNISTGTNLGNPSSVFPAVVWVHDSRLRHDSHSAEENWWCGDAYAQTDRTPAHIESLWRRRRHTHQFSVGLWLSCLRRESCHPHGPRGIPMRVPGCPREIFFLFIALPS